MNSSFSFRRLGWLIKLDLAENRNTYLLALSVLLSLMLLLMLPLLTSKTYNGNMNILHPMALIICFLGVSLLGSQAFTPYGTALRGIPAMMVPASQTEKFLSAWLIHLVLSLIFLGAFWGLHYGIIDLTNQRLPADGWKYRPIPPEVTQFFVYMHFLVHSVVFLGSIYFPKAAYLKSAGVLILVIVVGYLIQNTFVSQTIGFQSPANSFPFVEWTDFRGRRFEITYPEPVGKLVRTFLFLMVAGVWYIAYARLKEKEI